PVAAPARRGRAAAAAGPAEEPRLRGHRRGGPRVPAVDLLHRPERDRAGSVLVDGGPDRPAGGPRRRATVLRPRPGPRAARPPADRPARPHRAHQADRRDHPRPPPPRPLTDPAPAASRRARPRPLPPEQRHPPPP